MSEAIRYDQMSPKVNILLQANFQMRFKWVETACERIVLAQAITDC